MILEPMKNVEAEMIKEMPLIMPIKYYYINGVRKRKFQ